MAADRDQLMLMPPSVTDWLPEDHLAWFLLDVVAELDLSAFYAVYRADGRGGAAYDPRIMLTVLIYAYCTGERSSRRIEKRLIEDVAFRVVAANQRPDHATVARFRANHETAVAGLFGQALAVCARAGLLRPGLIAVDGTKHLAPLMAFGSAPHLSPALDHSYRLGDDRPSTQEVEPGRPSSRRQLHP